MKKVLITAPNYFTAPLQVGSHHLARAFARRGYSVAYLSAPISPFHRWSTKRTDFLSRKAIHEAGGEWEDGIWHYVPKAFLVPQNRFFLSSAWVIDHWRRFTGKDPVSLLRKQGFGTVDILWFNSPLYHFLMDEIEHDRSVLRLADFSRGLGASKAHFAKEVELAGRVDQVIYSAKSILDCYGEIRNRAKTFYVPNGIDLKRLNPSGQTLPGEFATIPAPRVVYTGEVGKWFDVDLLHKCAVTYPEYSFIVIGGIQIDLGKLKKLENVYLLGTRPYEEIGNYLSHSDIGIIPFRRTGFTATINPLKIYEYMSCGLKVVATRWQELEVLAEYCHLAANEDEFVRFLSQENCDNKRNPREFLEKNSWDAKLDSILAR